MNSTHVDFAKIVASMVSSKIESKPNKVASKAFVPSMKPCLTTSDAQAFVLSIRSAGLRQVEGRQVRDPGLVLSDETKAIDSFVGYDISEPHGSQLDGAMAQAQRILRPVAPATKEYSRCSPPTTGFVAGMPDNVSHQKAVLEAVLRSTVEEKCIAYAANDSKLCAKLDSQLTELRARLNSLG